MRVIDYICMAVALATTLTSLVVYMNDVRKRFRALEEEVARLKFKIENNEINK